MDDPNFLARWSRRKHEAARGAPDPVEPPAPVAAAPAAVAATPAPAPVAATPAVVDPAAVEPPPLPPLESLTIDSDFLPFLSEKVDESVKRAALRKLFSDPRFNVMDGLDIYIDDYTKPDPMPEGMLDRLAGVYKAFEERAAEVEPPRVVAGAQPEPPAVSVEPQAAAPQVATPQAAAAPQIAAPQVAAPEVATPEVATPRIATSEIAEAGVNEHSG